MNLLNSIKKIENNALRPLSSIYMHMFEQIACLYQYTIGVIRGDRSEASVLVQQLRFIAVVNKIYNPKNDDEKKRSARARILRLLDDGDKTLDILGKIKSDDQLFTELDVKYLERLLEENSILFPKTHGRHPYSIYAMHSILINPLPVLQVFLLLPLPVDIVAGVVCIYLKEKNTESPLLNFMSSRDENVSLSALLDFLSNGKPNIEKIIKENSSLNIEQSNFESIVMKSICSIIEEWSSNVFSKLFQFDNSPMPIFDGLLRLDDNEGRKSISINEREFKNICQLGQSDILGEVIARKLKTVYLKDDAVRDEILYGDKYDLKDVDRWFKKCKVGIITGMSQIPGFIASMILFRIENSQAIIHITNKDVSEYHVPTKNKVDNAQKLTTSIINSILYFNGDPYFPSQKFNFIRTDCSELDEVIENLLDKDAMIMPNTLMKDWTVYEKKTTRDRFKRPYRGFNKTIDSAKSKVREQQQKTMVDKFPIFSCCPRPFWSLDQ